MKLIAQMAYNLLSASSKCIKNAMVGIMGESHFQTIIFQPKSPQKQEKAHHSVCEEGISLQVTSQRGESITNRELHPRHDFIYSGFGRGLCDAQCGINLPPHLLSCKGFFTWFVVFK